MVYRLPISVIARNIYLYALIALVVSRRFRRSVLCEAKRLLTLGLSAVGRTRFISDRPSAPR